jgi:hypothetical protein
MSDFESINNDSNTYFENIPTDYNTILRYKICMDKGIKIYIKNILIDDYMFEFDNIEFFRNNLITTSDMKFIRHQSNYTTLDKFSVYYFELFKLRFFKLKLYQQIIVNKLKKKKMLINLNLYSEYCLNLYLHPSSKFMYFYSNNFDIFDDKKNKMIYVSNDNKVKIYYFKK